MLKCIPDYKIYINREANVIPKREEANQTSIDDAQTSFEKNLSHYDPPPLYEEVFNCDDLKFICDQKSFAHLNPAQDIEPSAPNLELISPQQNNNHDTDINPSSDSQSSDAFLGVKPNESKEKKVAENPKHIDLYKVIRELANFSGFFTSVETLANILSVSYDEMFNVIQVNEKIFWTINNVKSDNTVELCPEIDLCKNHLSSSGCLKTNCGNIHICLNFAAAICNIEDCPYGHLWKSNHNENIWRKYFLDELPWQVLDSLMKKVLRFAVDMFVICFNYHQQSCLNGDLCKHLHICYSYATTFGNCAKGKKCPYNHDIKEPSCILFFEKHNISVNDSPRDILKALANKYASTYKHSTQMSFRRFFINESGNSQEGCNTSTGITTLDISDESKKKPSGESNGGTAVNITDAEKRHKKQSMNNVNSENSKTVGEIKISWQIYGSFKVKLICFNGIRNRCWRAENAGDCPYLHASVPYQWQFGRGQKWYNFHPKHSEELERNYRDPECEFTHLQKLDNHLAFKNLQGILSLLGAERTKVDFIQNTIENEDTKETYSIRHITTVSSVINDNIFSTEFVWYFKNGTKWEILGSRKCPTEMIELAYKDLYTSFLYRSCKSSFHLDFEDMTRRSLATGNETEIRRRPAPFAPNRKEKRRRAN